MQAATCRSYPPATFFPSQGLGVLVAQQICSTCAVRNDCLEFALTERIDHGVWGGTSERQRRRLLRQRQQTAAPSQTSHPKPHLAQDRMSGID